MIYLGCHVSMKKPEYLLGSLMEADGYEANACMVFSGPPRNSKRVDVETLKINESHEWMKEHGWKPRQLVIHAPYIINLANCTNEQTYLNSLDLLKLEYQRAQAIGASYLVLHPGSHLKQGAQKGIEKIAQGLNELFDTCSGDVQIALETMAGKGSEIGRNFQELAEIINLVKDSSRVCVCMDTCHMHDAGYELNRFEEMLDEFDELIGLEKLKVLHINNSKNERGSRKDRHENLVYGKIDFEDLARIVHHPKLEDAIKILETPYRDEKPVYKEEIALLRQVNPWKGDVIDNHAMDQNLIDHNHAVNSSSSHSGS